MSTSTLITLSEIVETWGGLIQTGPFGSQLHQHDYSEQGVPVVMPKDIRNGRVDESGIARIPESKASQLSRHFLKAGSVVFPRRGEIGKCAYIDRNQEGFLCGTGCIKIEPPEGKLRSKFLFYFLGLRQSVEWLERNAVGTTMLNLNTKILGGLKVPLPSPKKQDDIVDILSTYDDLIENNRRRIQLLEQSARLLYKEWFVHLRFPGHEHTKIIDGIPEGWEKCTLNNALIELESGSRPKGGAQDKGIPSIGAENVLGIGQYDYSKEKYVPENYFKAMRKGIVRDRDIVVYKDGANIGRSSYFGDGFPHETCCVNEHVFILRAIEEIGQNWFYFWVSRDETRQRLANLNANTAQPGISQSKLLILNFIRPSKTITKIFNDVVEPMVKQIFVLAKANHTLMQARDLLLPKLMNGEVAV